MADEERLPTFGLNPGPLAPGAPAPASPHATITVFGGGRPGGTPLDPPSNPLGQLDPTITQAQVDRYVAARQKALEETPVGILGRAVAASAPALVGGAAAMLGGPLGGAAGVLARMGLAGAGSGATHYAIHRDLPGAIREGVLGAVVQGPGEALAASRAMRTRQGPLRDELTRQQQTDAAYLRDLAAHPAAAAANAEHHAAALGDKLKQTVPPWAGIDSTPAGLAEMIGPGWTKVQAAYDDFLRRTIPGARGQRVQITADAAQDLKVTPLALVTTSKSRISPRPDRVDVDAGELLEKMIGKSRRAPRAYNEAAAALDSAGFGDPAIRAMYRDALSFKAFAEKNRIVENGVLHPDRIQSGLAGMQPRRAADVRQGPLEPELREATPIPKPQAPVYESPVTEIGSGQSPLAHTAGHVAAHATHLPWSAGYGLGRALGKIQPGRATLEAPPFSVLGGPTGHGVLSRGQEIGARALGTGVAQGANAATHGLYAASPSVAEGWRYILENLPFVGEPRYQEDTPAPKPSPLRPATIDEEER